MRPFSSRKPLFHQKIRSSHLFSHFITLLLQILVGTYAWAVPPAQIWGDRPPVPPKSLPIACLAWFDPRPRQFAYCSLCVSTSLDLSNILWGTKKWGGRNVVITDESISVLNYCGRAPGLPKSTPMGV